MDVTPLGTTNVPDAEKNWLRVLPSSASAVSKGLLTQLALVPSVPKNFPAFPVCPGSTAVMPEAAKMDAATCAVVAICVVLVPAAAVGAAGVPVNVGEAVGALVSICVWIADVTPATWLSSVCVAVTAPVTFGNVAFTVLLIKRRWSSPSLLGSEAAG
jgi:hypothetical protein